MWASGAWMRWGICPATNRTQRTAAAAACHHARGTAIEQMELVEVLQLGLDRGHVHPGGPHGVEHLHLADHQHGDLGQRRREIACTGTAAATRRAWAASDACLGSPSGARPAPPRRSGRCRGAAPASRCPSGLLGASGSGLGWMWDLADVAAAGEVGVALALGAAAPAGMDLPGWAGPDGHRRPAPDPWAAGLPSLVRAFFSSWWARVAPSMRAPRPGRSPLRGGTCAAGLTPRAPGRAGSVAHGGMMGKRPGPACHPAAARNAKKRQAEEGRNTTVWRRDEGRCGLGLVGAGPQRRRTSGIGIAHRDREAS